MPVGIMQILNNTKFVIGYRNLESGHTFEVKPKPQGWFDNTEIFGVKFGGGSQQDYLIPSSDIKDDTLPWYSAYRWDKIIRIKVGAITLKLCERDARFYLGYISGRSNQETYEFMGRLDNGGRYVIRIDEVKDRDERVIYFSIYNWNDRFWPNSGFVKASSVEYSYANVAAFPVARIRETRKEGWGGFLAQDDTYRPPEGFWKLLDIFV